MGYDAFVKCNCFKEGEISKRPPYEQHVYEDNEGVWLDLEWERNKEKFLEFEAWKSGKPCKHEDMELCNEHLANIAGMGGFKAKISELGKSIYPILSEHLPKANDGLLSMEHVHAMQMELKNFDIETNEKFSYVTAPLKRLLDASIESGNPVIWT